MRKLGTIKSICSLVVMLVIAYSVMACSRSKVTCPGSGQNSASDMALFDEDGKPIQKKKKKKKTSKKNDYGIINKNQPKHMKRKR